MKRLITTAITLAAAIVPALPAFAQTAAPLTTAQVPAGAPALKECGPKAKFSDEQLEKMHSLRLKFAADNDAKKAQLHTLRGQLKDEITKPAIDKSAALSIQSKINALQADLANARLAMMIETSTVFTPEQRQAFRHRMLVGEMMGGHRFGRHHGGGHGGGFHGGPAGHHGPRGGGKWHAEGPEGKGPTPQAKT